MRFTDVLLSTLFLSIAVPLAGAAEIKVINAKALFPEGPVMSNGKLLYVEYAGNTADSWDGKTNTQFWKQDGCGPSAIVPLGSDFGITCYDSGQLVVISANGETITEGPRLQNARIPTHSAECVSVQASQSVAICCTQSPVQDKALQP